MSERHSRPRWHFAPRATWLNDPNGLIHRDGVWHLFFQTNPDGCDWGNMSWGHATSTDLLTWRELPIALAADANRQVFSGSCVLDVTNSSLLGSVENPPLIAIYTAHYGPASGREGIQAQCLAYSLDGGTHWVDLPDNPVLDRGSANFRDPKVFRHGDRWVMVAVEAEQRQVLIYRSADLVHWSHASTFGPANATGGAWECPDLFPLRVDGSDEVRWVLLVSLYPGGVAGGGGCQYFVGDFDGERFVPDPDDPAGTRSEGVRGYDWFDLGRDCYAVASFADAPDGRRVALGWMNNWDYARNVPLTGGRGMMTIPRELGLCTVGGRLQLRQRPVRELPAGALKRITLCDGSSIGCGPATLAYADGVLRVEQQRSDPATGRRLEPDWATVPGRPASLDVTVLVDTHSLEVFAADGLVAITSLVF